MNQKMKRLDKIRAKLARIDRPCPELNRIGGIGRLILQDKEKKLANEIQVDIFQKEIRRVQLDRLYAILTA
jgi:hypothetical protein